MSDYMNRELSEEEKKKGNSEFCESDARPAIFK